MLRTLQLATQNNIDTTVPKAHHRKKVVATASRREYVYKRTGEPSMPFYEKGGTAKQVTDFFAKKNRNKRNLFRRGAVSDVKSEPKTEFSISSKVIVSVPSL